MNSLDCTGQSGIALDDFFIIGSGPNYSGHPSPQITDSGQFGLKFAATPDWKIRDFAISNKLGAGIDFSASTGWDDAGSASGGRIRHCYRGIHTRAGGEYANFHDLFLSNNVFGLHCDSGNNSFSLIKATKNSIGMFFSGGSNHAHGTVTGCTANHNNQNLVVYDVSIGQEFVGCNFFGHLLGGANLGSIEIARSNIGFIGGHIGSTRMTLDATSKVWMRGVMFSGAVELTVVPGTVLDAKDAIVLPGANLTINGVAWNGNT